MRTRRYRKRGGADTDEPAPPSMIDKGVAILKNPLGTISEAAKTASNTVQESVSAASGNLQSLMQTPPMETLDAMKKKASEAAAGLEATVTTGVDQMKERANNIGTQVSDATTKFTTPAKPTGGGRRRKSKRKRAKRRTRR